MGEHGPRMHGASMNTRLGGGVSNPVHRKYGEASLSQKWNRHWFQFQLCYLAFSFVTYHDSQRFMTCKTVPFGANAPLMAPRQRINIMSRWCARVEGDQATAATFVYIVVLSSEKTSSCSSTFRSEGSFAYLARGPVVVIKHVHLRPSLEQRLDHLQVPLVGCVRWTIRF